MRKFTLIFSAFFVLFFVVFASSSFAMTVESEGQVVNVPDIESALTTISSNYTYKEYVLFERSVVGDTDNKVALLVYYSKSPMNVRVYTGTSNKIFFCEMSGNYNSVFFANEYVIKDGAWKLYGNVEKHGGESTSISHTGTVYLSTQNIYKGKTNDELFFQVAPTVQTPTLEETLAVEIPALGEKVTQTMKIILLCGVGCLALLISLPVLSKVLFRYLGK